VTPFDADALLAMLLAFYPRPGGAALRRARLERPEYFAGGTIIGSSSTHLQLPDGRIFDLVFDEGSARARWQVLYDDPNAPDAGVDDPFALEQGPLDFVDEDVVIFPDLADSFEGLVSDGLQPLSGAEGALDAAADAATAADGSADLESSYAALVEPAARAHADIRAALDGDEFSDELRASDDQGRVPPIASTELDEPPPPDVAEPDPGEPPPDKGEPGGPQPPDL
jgi:hypothetical protein